MTNTQIKAELRRSALNDRDPAFQVDDWGFYAALSFRKYGEEELSKMKVTECRIFFLLVAEAL